MLHLQVIRQFAQSKLIQSPHCDTLPKQAVSSSRRRSSPPAPIRIWVRPQPVKRTTPARPVPPLGNLGVTVPDLRHHRTDLMYYSRAFDFILATLEQLQAEVEVALTSEPTTAYLVGNEGLEQVADVLTSLEHCLGHLINGDLCGQEISAAAFVCASWLVHGPGEGEQRRRMSEGADSGDVDEAYLIYEGVRASRWYREVLGFLTTDDETPRTPSDAVAELKSEYEGLVAAGAHNPSWPAWAEGEEGGALSWDSLVKGLAGSGQLSEVSRSILLAAHDKTLEDQMGTATGLSGLLRCLKAVLPGMVDALTQRLGELGARTERLDALVQKASLPVSPNGSNKDGRSKRTHATSSTSDSLQSSSAGETPLHPRWWRGRERVWCVWGYRKRSRSCQGRGNRPHRRPRRASWLSSSRSPPHARLHLVRGSADGHLA